MKVFYPDEGDYAAQVLYFLKVVRKPPGEAEAPEDQAKAAAVEESASEATGGSLRPVWAADTEA